MYDFIYKNAKIILDKVESFDKLSRKRSFTLDINTDYRFYILGEGSFGIVLKVIFGTETFVAKIMKTEDEEPKKLSKLQKKINSISSEKIKILLDKYITKIFDIHLKTNPQVIIFEYLDGSDLSDYLNTKSDEELSHDEFYNIITKLILSVILLHNKLRMSHRDLKPQNIFYNSVTGKFKLIDFGFSCSLNSKKCFNRYQGTSNYIHPRMNDKKMRGNVYNNSMNSLKTKKNNSLNSTRMKSNRIKSNKNNALQTRFPKARSQDIFSIIIIILNIYTYVDVNSGEKDTSQDIELQRILKYFFSPTKIKNKKKRFERRLNKKKNLFKDLNNLDEKILSNPLISKLIFYIKKYWNFNENNFIVGRRDYSKEVLEVLLDESISNLPKNQQIIYKNEKEIIGN